MSLNSGFLESKSTSCTRIFTNLSKSCITDPALDAASYYRDFTVLKVHVVFLLLLSIFPLLLQIPNHSVFKLCGTPWSSDYYTPLARNSVKNVPVISNNPSLFFFFFFFLHPSTFQKTSVIIKLLMHRTGTSSIFHNLNSLTTTLLHFKQTVYQSILISSVNLINQAKHILRKK